MLITIVAILCSTLFVATANFTSPMPKPVIAAAVAAFRKLKIRMVWHPGNSVNWSETKLKFFTLPFTGDKEKVRLS